jgi:ankyrin repeat protein
MKRKRDENDSELELEHQQKGAKEDESHNLFERASGSIFKFFSNLYNLYLTWRAGNIYNAARTGNVRALRAFIKAGVGVDARDGWNNQTPLHVAAKKGQDLVVRTLIELGADINARDGWNNRTPLHLAAKKGQDLVVRTLIELGADKDVRDELNRTPLHGAADQGQDLIVRTLIELGADKDVRDELNRTPLHAAAERGKDLVVRTLIELGADINARDTFNRTPLHLAAKKGQDLVVRTLIELGADIDARDEFGQTPLHVAAYYGRDLTVRTLIELGADKEVRDRWGRTPLHWAAARGHDLIVRTLIALDADKEARCLWNQTPLHLAAYWGYLATIQALVEGGANIHALAQEGGDESAIVLAFEQGHHAVVNYLLQQGAVLPERLRAGAGAGNDINESQSVHTVSVHIGVSEAAKALKARYLPEDKKQSNEKTNTSITALKTRVNQLPYNAEVEGVTNKNGAAQRCLTWLPGVKFTDLRSGVTLDEAIALVWMGLTDSDEIKRKRAERGLFDDEKALSEIEVEEKLQKEEVEELDKIAAQWLYEITRGYNLSKKGVDDGLADRHTCVSGSFNKSIYTLNGIHPLVNIPYVTQKTITARAITLVDEIFNHLPEDAKKHFAGEFEDSLSGELLEIIKEDLAKKLHAEYDEFNGEGLDVDAIIGENLQCLEYMAPKSLVELKAKLEKEMEVEESAEISASPRPRMG